jgi:hypothetical protein
LDEEVLLNQRHRFDFREVNDQFLVILLDLQIRKAHILKLAASRIKNGLEHVTSKRKTVPELKAIEGKQLVLRGWSHIDAPAFTSYLAGSHAGCFDREV